MENVALKYRRRIMKGLLGAAWTKWRALEANNGGRTLTNTETHENLLLRLENGIQHPGMQKR